MPDYKHILDAIASGSLAANGLSSAAANALDMPELVSWSTGTVRAQWLLNPDYLNSRGALFGGYYGVLADIVLAFATMSVLERHEYFATQDLNLSFFKPIVAGTVYFSGEVITRTRSRVYCQCQFLDDENNVLALASAAQHIRSSDQS
jgi:uncharacterized protein (TIGR00369 family)